MAYIQHLWLYFALVAGIVIVPGMDMMFVLANALVGGRRAGIGATAGIMLGGVCHTLIGLTAVAVLSRLVPVISSAMLVVGSLYMGWIGYTLMRSAITVGDVGAERQRPVGKVFAQGLFTNIVNPKAWLFVLSVIPQFLKPEFGPLLPQAFAIGLITISVQGVVYGGLALAALRGRDALVTNPATTIWLGRAAGALLASIAAVTLLQSLQSLI